MKRYPRCEVCGSKIRPGEPVVNTSCGGMCAGCARHHNHAMQMRAAVAARQGVRHEN